MIKKIIYNLIVYRPLNMLIGKTQSALRSHLLKSDKKAFCSDYINIKTTEKVTKTPTDICQSCLKHLNEVTMVSYRESGVVPMELEPEMCSPEILKEAGIPIPITESYRKTWNISSQLTIDQLFI